MPTAITAARPLQIPAATVDDYCDLDAKHAAFAPTERLYQKCREQLKLLVADSDPEAEFIVKGERWTLRISACGLESKPDVKAARKLLGAATFLECVTLTFKSLENWLLKPQIAKITVTTQTGSRSYSPTPIAPPL